MTHLDREQLAHFRVKHLKFIIFVLKLLCFDSKGIVIGSQESSID